MDGDIQENLLLDVVSHLSSDDERIVHQLLLKALESKNFRSFEKTINHNLTKRPPLDINFVFPHRNEETCLDIASMNGLTEFVKFLLLKGANPNRANKAHKRAPIHSAAEKGYTSTLQALLEDPRTDPDIQAGMQTALHIAVKSGDLTCVAMLLQKGASASIPDSKGQTALHDAAKLRHREMTELILKQCRQHLDVDSYKDFRKQTTREIIEKNLPDLVPLLPPKDQDKVPNPYTLQYYLNANDEINFLRNLELVELETLLGVVEELLETAADRNFHEVVTALLKKLKGKQFSVRRAAVIAVQYGHLAVLRELLRAKPDVANDLILYACMELGTPGKRGDDNTSDRLECLKLILKENVDVRCTDNKGNTPLHHAARANCHEAVCLLLERGSYIGHLNNYGVPPIADISTCTLKQYFDGCLQIRKKGQPYDINAEVPMCTRYEYKVEFDYRCLMPHDVYDKNRQTSEMDLFKYIQSQKNMKHLLTHPLLSSYLYIKWYKIRHFLFANFIFYVIFFILLNTYVLSKVYHVPSCKNGTREGDNFGNDTEVVNCEHVVFTSWWANLLWILVAVLLSLFAFREFLQIASYPCRYMKNSRNYLLVALIAFTTALLCGADLQIGAVVILISTWELIFLISQHPRMSTDIEMFRTVSLKFARFLIPYMLLIIAFALSFYTLFKDSEDTHFRNFALSLFKTVIMFSGEFDASDIPFVSYPIWSRVVFILFVLLLPIVLFNLLNGLAVSDTAKILCRAELVVQVSRIHLLAYIEDMATGKPYILCCRNSRWNPFNFLAERLRNTFDYCDTDNNHENYIYIRSESVDDDKITKMDRDIIKQAKQIICNRNRPSEDEKIIVALNNVQAKLTAMENTLNTVRLAVENNNFNNIETIMEA